MTAKHAMLFVGIVAAIVTAISIVPAEPAAADPGDGCNVNPPTPDCTGSYPWDPVPGMKRAEVGNFCADTGRFIFAASPTGEMLACRGRPARYIRTSTAIVGVRLDGAPCSEHALAQSPDGSPLQCSTTGNGPALWRVYVDTSVTDQSVALPTRNRMW